MANWIEMVNLPSEAGFYWARTSGFRWWNLVVRVYGDAPFFQIDAWNYIEKVLILHANVYDICEFGPPISHEAPAIIEQRKDWS